MSTVRSSLRCSGSAPFSTDFRISLSLALQILLSADYETPKDLVNRLPLLTEVDEDDLEEGEGDDHEYDDDEEDEDDESTARGAGSSSPNISLLTGVTSLASIDGAVRRSQMRAGMRGRRGRGARSMTATTTTSGATTATTLSSDVSLKSGDKRELFLEVSYSDPRDSKLYTEPGADPAADSLIYKLYVGGKFGGGGEHYYYCRPYGHVYQSIEVKGEAAAANKSGERKDEDGGLRPPTTRRGLEWR